MVIGYTPLKPVWIKGYSCFRGITNGKTIAIQTLQQKNGWLYPKKPGTRMDKGIDSHITYNHITNKKNKYHGKF